MRRLFKYLQPLWLGSDGKIALRATLAIIFSIDFVRNMSHAVYKWEAGKSFEGLSLIAGIEAGLILGCLGITALTNVSMSRIDASVTNSAPAPINIEKVNTVTTGDTKAETVVAEKVDTVNSQNTTISSKVDNPDA